MPGRKKKFPCGHVGQGQYCHRCESKKKPKLGEKSAEEKSAWKALFDEDVVDLRALPNQSTVLKARKILGEIEDGVPYTNYLGKRLNHDRTIISVPLTRHYRILFRDEGGTLTPMEVLSHEDYNTKKPGA